MDAKLLPHIPPGHWRDERLQIARKIADLCIERHGDAVSAVGVYGATAVALNALYSDTTETVRESPPFQG